MNYIKKIIIQVEDSDGKVWDNEIEGLYVRSIDINQPLYRDPFMRRFMYRDGPMEVTIKLEAWGDMWSSVRTQHDSYREEERLGFQDTRKLPSPAKQLPEHKDE
jgi:hypothetical protein